MNDKGSIFIPFLIGGYKSKQICQKLLLINSLTTFSKLNNKKVAIFEDKLN